jgi:hypothetical protein
MLKKMLLTASAVAIAVTVFGNMALAQSEEETAKACDPDNLTHSGTLQFSMKSVGFLLGVRWGEGVLTMNDGFQLSFDVAGAKLLETGIAKANFEGDVYNLNNLEDFEGIYFGASTKITVIKGKGELRTNNANCVHIRARSTGGGLQLSAPAPEGLAIKFER